MAQMYVKYLIRHINNNKSRDTASPPRGEIHHGAIERKRIASSTVCVQARGK